MPSWGILLSLLVSNKVSLSLRRLNPSGISFSLSLFLLRKQERDSYYLLLFVWCWRSFQFKLCIFRRLQFWRSFQISAISLDWMFWLSQRIILERQSWSLLLQRDSKYSKYLWIHEIAILKVISNFCNFFRLDVLTVPKTLFWRDSLEVCYFKRFKIFQEIGILLVVHIVYILYIRKMKKTNKKL
jgi:hypothetical protein